MTNNQSSRTSSQRMQEVYQARVNQSRNPWKRWSASKKIVSVISVAVVVMGVLFVIGFQDMFGSNDNAQHGATGEQANPSVSQQKRSVSGKNVDQDRKDATKSAERILTLSQTGKDDNFEKRIKKIDKGDLSSIPKDLTKKIRFTDAFDDDEELKYTTYQSLIALDHAMLKGKDPQLAQSDAWKSVYVDQKTGTAYVPLGIFAGTDVPFSFEMNYIDGHWELAPYSFIEQVKMSSAFNGGDGPDQQQGQSPQQPGG